MIQFKPIDAEGIQDRAYRIYYNEGQNRTDRFSQVATCLATPLQSEASEPQLCTCHSIQPRTHSSEHSSSLLLIAVRLAVRASFQACCICLLLALGARLHRGRPSAPVLRTHALHNQG
jgi:hypothetical protein